MNDFNPRPDEARSAAIRAMLVENAARSKKSPRIARRVVSVVGYAAAVALVIGLTSAILSGDLHVGGLGGPVAARPHGQVPIGVGPGSTAGPSASPSAPTSSAPTSSAPTSTAPSATHTASPTKAPDPASSSAPSASPVSDLDTLVLRADGFHFVKGTTSLGTASTSSVPAAVDELTTALGAPTVTTTSAGGNPYCSPAATTYDWGDGALRVVEASSAADAFDAYTVRILKKSLLSAKGATVALKGPGDIGVGQNIAAKLAAGTDVNRSTYQAPDGSVAGTLVIEPNASGTGGVGVFTTDDVVTVIGSPVYVNGGDC